MQLSQIVVERIIRNLFANEDYRQGILSLINADFLDFCISFFKQVVDAKLNDQEIDTGWYKHYFLHNDLRSDDIIIHAGLNRKTVTNIYGSARRDVVLNVTYAYYDELLASINALAEADDLEIELTIKFKGVSVDLNLSETLIVINTLAVKRAAIRGGAWSTAGKQIELPLMLTLAKLYQVPAKHYELKGLTSQNREVDFHFINRDGLKHECEVKLMGQGNPESADAVIARDSSIFIAHTLSALNKTQLTQRGIKWVELHQPEGYKRMYEVLQQLHVPSQPFEGDVKAQLDIILPQVFDELNFDTL